MESPTYSYQSLFNFTVNVLQKMGFKEEHAKECAVVFLKAELRAISTHGVIRLCDYLKLWEKGRINTSPNVQIVHETHSTAVVDGDGTIGMIPAHIAMRKAIEKAKNVGSGWVCVKNSCNFGIAGYYAMMALEHDMIGVTMTNASALVAPTFSAEALMGTNPIAVAIPALHQPPFVADFATTPVTRGKFTLAAKKGEKMNYGYAQDADGHPSNDPNILAHGGTMLPLGGSRENGGHKGYCLGAMVDILTGVLSGANFGPFVPPMVPYLDMPKTQVGKGLGHFFGAIRVDGFMPAIEFKQRMDKWVETFRSARPATGCEKVLIPGDVEREAEVRILKEGITLLPQVEKDMIDISKRFNIPFNH